jgi:hypothetical protein
VRDKVARHVKLGCLMDWIGGWAVVLDWIGLDWWVIGWMLVCHN